MKINWRKGYSIQHILMLISLLISIGCFSQFGYIKIKAYLAQVFLDSAWQKTLAQYQVSEDVDKLLMVKPWPWADVYPVGKLFIPKLDLSYIVLNNDSGQALAFGPGVSGVNKRSTIDANNTQVISGHRDSHFEFLADVVNGDEILFELPSGQIKKYRIDNSFVIDSRIEQVYLPDSIGNTLSGLVLITCYPFNSVTASTPFRLIVEANEINKNTFRTY
ncbi:MAG: class GN sortase [Colwellia sp.]|nr:class GN sortase [Colwellia sp.]